MAGYTLREEELKQIKDLYIHGCSSYEIREILKLPQLPRTIQRRIKAMGITRPIREAYRLALAKGRGQHERKRKVGRFCPHCKKPLW